MHLNEKLRDTIVDQAMEIAGLRSRLDNSEYWRRRNIEMLEESNEQAKEMNREIAELKTNLDASERAWDELWERVKELEAKEKDMETLPTPDDISIGLTD